MSLAKLLRPRVCELGKIKIGGLGDEKVSRSGNKYRVPVKYDHFVITTLYRGPDGKLVEDAGLMAALKPLADADGRVRSLPISLLSNDIDEVLQASYQWFDGKRLAAKSDGETVTKYADFKTGAWLKEPETLPWRPEYADLKDGGGKPRFKLHCTMNVVIASAEAKWGGFYKFRTTSAITADQLYGSLVHLRQLTGGVLRGLPLRLVVRPLQVCPPPDHKPTTVFVVHVELAGSDVTAIQAKALELARFEVQHAKQLAAAQAEYKQLLRAPDEFLDDDEEAEVAQEFAPHQQPGMLPPAQPPAQPAQQQQAPPAQPVRAPAPAPDGEKSLADGYADEILEAATAADLQALVERMNADVKRGAANGGLTRADTERLAPLVLNHKATLAARAAEREAEAAAAHDAEGEQRADFPPRPDSVPAASTPPTTTATTGPAPSAASRTSAAAPATATSTTPADPVGGPAIDSRLLGEIFTLMHEVDVNWFQVRDRAEGRGAKLAGAAGVVGRPGMRINELPAATAVRLRDELQQLVDKKKESSAKREATAAQKRAEEVGAAS